MQTDSKTIATRPAKKCYDIVEVLRVQCNRSIADVTKPEQLVLSVVLLVWSMAASIVKIGRVLGWRLLVVIGFER
jgi:hypothetical protein